MTFPRRFVMPDRVAIDRHRWAICCSGGGIRSAAYCLGGLQRLTEAGIPGRTDQVVGVSGGAYIAAARALAAHRPPGSVPYAPGSAQERHLRNNTHYLAPNARTLLAGVLSLLFGAVIISVIVLAAVLAVAYVLGAVASWAGVLRPGPGNTVAVDLTAERWWWAVPVAATVAVVAAFVWWRFDRHRRSASTVLLGRLAAVAAGSAALLLATPLMVSWVSHIGVGHRAVGAPGWILVPPSVLAAVTAAVPLLTALVGRSRSARGPSADAPRTFTGTLAGLGRRVVRWLGFAAIVVLVLVAWLAWVRHAAMAPGDRGTWAVVLAALGVVVAGRFAVDLNRLSMHDFYRWRLAEGYTSASRADAEGDAKGDAETRLSELTDVRLAIATTANVNADRERPPGHGSCLLTFDPQDVQLWTPGGQPSQAVARTADMEWMVGRKRLTLFDIVAVSGAALSPLMGSRTQPGFRLPMVVANVRLGLWMPHPAVVASARSQLEQGKRDNTLDQDYRLGRLVRLLAWYPCRHRAWRRRADSGPVTGVAGTTFERREALLWSYALYLREQVEGAESGTWRRHARDLRACVFYQLLQPTLGLLWAELAGHLSYRSTWVYVTDGGHYDNLGLLDALHRGADRVVVLDAGGDPSDRWSTIGGAEALARMDAGVEIDLDPSTMRPAGPDGGDKLQRGEVVTPWAGGRFTRAGAARTGRIWVCKLGWWRACSWDLRAYAGSHRTFPNDTTAQQLFDADEFEAYRALGYAAAGVALRDSDLAAEIAADHPAWHRTVLRSTTFVDGR